MPGHFSVSENRYVEGVISVLFENVLHFVFVKERYVGTFYPFVFTFNVSEHPRNVPVAVITYVIAAINHHLVQFLVMIIRFFFLNPQLVLPRNLKTSSVYLLR